MVRKPLIQRCIAEFALQEGQPQLRFRQVLRFHTQNIINSNIGSLR
ncbi:hypothetical protein KKI93_22010 [Xenorhabdus bovienii]|nr:hypothetical protein [Xenorhabdus bovienii]MDE9488192.1 hypothetical protein [Xenorhabdus bovienii]MDE9566614.1 hypothetical protein [Xenorhabdus bovienii]